MFRSEKQERENYTKGTRNYDTAMVKFYDEAGNKRRRNEKIINAIFGVIFFVSFTFLILLFVYAVLSAV